MALEQEPLDPVVNVVPMCGVVVAPCVDLVGQPKRFLLVVFAVQPVIGDRHFGIGVHALFRRSGCQLPQFADIIVERIGFFGIGGILHQDRHGCSRHGIGVADGCRFAEKLDRIGQVEVRIFVEVFQVEQQLHPFPGIGRIGEHMLETVRHLLVGSCIQTSARQHADCKEYFPETGHL